MKNLPEEFSPRPPWGASPQPVSNFAPGLEIDYQSLLKRLKRSKWWFALSLALCISGAWLHLRYETPIYLAQASMLVEETSENGAGLSKEFIAQELGFENNYVIENELYVLRSSNLMERVVDKLGLETKYVHLGQIRDTEIYHPQSFSLLPTDTLHLPAGNEPIEYGNVFVRLDNAQSFSLIRGEADTVKMAYGSPFSIGNRRFRLVRNLAYVHPQWNSIYQLSVSKPADVAKQYVSKLNVSQQGRSGMVKLSLEDPIPEKAVDILNSLVELYGRQIIEEQSKTGEQTLNFIEERLAFVTKELYEVESNVAGFKASRGLGVDLSTRGADYLAQLNEADALLSELQVKIDLIENLRQTLVSGSQRYAPLPATSEIISTVLGQLIQEYNGLILKREQELEVVTAEHPSMATFEESLRNLKSSILQSINTVLRETRERARTIEARIRPLEENMNRIPENQRKLVQIMRQQQIKENLFLFLLQKREEAALSVAAQVPNTRIVDRASTSSSPISPKHLMIYLLAIGLALSVPSSVIFGTELLSNSVGTEKEIVKRMELPVLGRVTRAKKYSGLVVARKRQSGIAEAFRMLRTNLGFMLSRKSASVVLITSSISGEGKSFICANLGATFAQANKKVVVINLDLRKPKLGRLIKEGKFDQAAPGLSNYLIGKVGLDTIVQPTQQPNLSLIQSGPVPPDPAELLLSKRLPEMIAELRKEYDLILIDLPPVGIVSDALLLKDEADLTLYITRLGVTPKKSLTLAREIVHSGKLPRINLVVNGVNPKDEYGYGYGYYK